jgi:hypothetical protein
MHQNKEKKNGAALGVPDVLTTNFKFSVLPSGCVHFMIKNALSGIRDSFLSEKECQLLGILETNKQIKTLFLNFLSNSSNIFIDR